MTGVGDHESDSDVETKAGTGGDHEHDTNIVKPSEVEREDQQRTEDETSNYSEIQEAITKFVSWMLSPDGGSKHETSVSKHAAQMYTLLSLAQQNNITWWDRSTLDVFMKFAAQKRYLPATKKSYLSSMKHFCKYALDTNVGNDRVVEKMHDRVSSWITTCRKEFGKHQQVKMDSDFNKLVTPEDVAQFHKSEPATTAIKLIGASEDGSRSLVQTEYITVRDYILAEVALKNANRSGVLAHMTVNELLAARLVDGQYVVSVAEHKTATTYGAAKVVLTPSLHQYMTVYCVKFRSQVVPANNTPSELFLSWNGLPMTSGQITRCLQSVWHRAGLGSDITFNLVRKSAVSAMHDIHPQMSAKLADLMCHRQTTAEKCYRIVERERNSVLASTKLADAFSTQEPQSGETAEGTKEVKQVSKGSHSEEVQSSKRLMIPERVDRTEPEMEVLEDANEAVPSSSSSRFLWTDRFVLLIRNLFRNEIESHNISLETVKRKIEQNEILRSIGSRKVYDRIRAEIKSDSNKSSQASLPQVCDTLAHRVERMFSSRKKQRESVLISDVEEVTKQSSEVTGESSESDFVAPTSRKDIFSKEHLKVLMVVCAPILKAGSISTKRIADELQKSAKGRKFLQLYTLFQLQNRLKYERRKMITVTLPDTVSHC